MGQVFHVGLQAPRRMLKTLVAEDSRDVLTSQPAFSFHWLTIPA
jgi:hypothetical protein